MLTSVPLAHGELLECATWDEREGAFWCVDILAPALKRLDPVTGVITLHPMPAHIGSFALREAGGLIVALRTGVFLYDPATARLDQVWAADWDPATARANDGRCDRQGRFWFGTIFEPRTHAGGAFYRVDTDLTVTKVWDGVTISNGLAFSPDGSKLYHADTPTQTITVSDLDAVTGAVSNRRVFASLEPEGCKPDGATVDAEGGYWVAGIHGGKLIRFSPDGVKTHEVPVPTRWPTMPCLGGATLQTWFVTSLREGKSAEDLAAYPMSGHLFTGVAPVRGVAEVRFKG
jgi:sugar lactone lactonase YvrE